MSSGGSAMSEDALAKAWEETMSESIVLVSLFSAIFFVFFTSVYSSDSFRFRIMQSALM